MRHPTPGAPATPNPLTFFPWCQQAGINPLTEMSRDRLREWLRAKQAAGVPARIRKPPRVRLRLLPSGLAEVQVRPGARAAISHLRSPTVSA